MRGRDLRTNEGPRKKMHAMAQTDRRTDRQTHGHGDSMTNLEKCFS